MSDSRGISKFLFDATKQSEGFYRRSYWDYKQHTVGYGTKARFPGETITEPEAARRLTQELEKAAGYVDELRPDIPGGTRDALISLTMNAGPGWRNAGLGRAVKNGRYDAAARRFVQYNKAGGRWNQGLQNRRDREIKWFGEGSQTPGRVSSAPADPPDPHAAQQDKPFIDPHVANSGAKPIPKNDLIPSFEGSAQEPTYAMDAQSGGQGGGGFSMPQAQQVAPVAMQSWQGAPLGGQPGFNSSQGGNALMQGAAPMNMMEAIKLNKNMMV